MLAAIAADGLDANISVKLTGLGLKLDLGLCRSLVEELVRAAGDQGARVRIDMEDATCVDDTLALYRELRAAGLDNVGIVLQAYLKRTLDDIEDLRELRPSVRLCKGIYVEPRAIAFHDADVVRRSFVGCLDALLDGGSRVAIATHDEQLLVESLARVEGLSEDGYEFQMLLGVRESRATELVAAGHPVRVYVPFGQRWYEYSLRRLQENPRMAGVIAKATVGARSVAVVARKSCHARVAAKRRRASSSVARYRRGSASSPARFSPANHVRIPEPLLRRQAEAAVDDQRLAADHVRVR